MGSGPGTPRPPRPALDPLAVRRLLRDDGLRARHGLSQNFLADPDVLEAILEAAEVGSGDRVLEIGPGLGVLTGGLLDAGAAVVAVELDTGLAGVLRGRFATALARGAGDPWAPGALTLHEGDALDLDLPGLVPPPYSVVANLPYHITSPILHRLLGGRPRPTRLVVMVQREVAERLAAPPGRMSYLSVFVQFHAAVQVVRLVPPGAFEPAPSVESAIVVLEPHRPGDRPGDAAFDRPDGPAGDRAGGATADEESLWSLVQAGFRERRKMLRNVLGRQLPAGQAAIDAALAVAAIAGDRRPQTLSVAEWIRLRAALDAVR